MLYQTKNPHGGDIYEKPIRLDYSANTNPFGTPQGVLDAIQKALPEIHHYPDPYCRRLVYAISAFEHVPQEWILCGNGAAELIYAYCEAVRPNTAVLLAPTFSEYANGLARVGCTVQSYALEQRKQFALDDAFLDYLIVQQPEAAFLCNPNNPTGQTISQPLLERILQVCQTKGIRLFLDECFLDLAEYGTSAKPYLEQYSQVFLLKAFTKSYGMAGLRLGYGLSSDAALLEAMANAVQPWNVSLLAQAAGVAALQEGMFLQKTRDVLWKERRWLSEELASLGFWVCPGVANYILFQGRLGLDLALQEYQIAIRNCANYEGLESGWYRIAVRRHEENEQLLSAMRQICRKETTWQKTL